jgi:hypothetical protein
MRRKSLVAALCLAMASAASAGESNSVYTEVASDQVVGPTDTIVLTQTVSLAENGWVYLQSDGRYIPSGAAIATTQIFVDGSPVSNASVTDWSVSKSPQQHSYNNIGAIFLPAGSHAVQLHASSQNSRSFTIGAGSNLSILVKPAATVATGIRGSDSGTVSPNTAGLTTTSILPIVNHVNVAVDGGSGQPFVALSSARIFRFGNAGDPLTSIALDGATLPNNQASWSDNDMYEYAENQAPFFTQAFIPSLLGAHTASLASSALPYSGENVQYRVGADSTLVALTGGMTVVGAAAAPSDSHNVTNYICVATSQGSPGCPAIGTDVVVAEGDIVVPAGHNGVVLVSGKTRIQADASDLGGQSLVYLTIDGIRRGSLGAQQLASPSAVSTRTIGTSYLATGAAALTPGIHHVVLHAVTSGNFIHLAMTRDLPLIWFD